MNGETGFCGETSELRIASMLPHFGEEPCLVGKYGSGTVFFTGCSCGCFFCQNYQLSHEHIGRLYTQEEFTAGLRELLAKGVHNLNFVTPDHFWPHISKACRTLRAEGVEVPFLWNCSGYSNAELIPEQAKIIDAFMPDFKYALPELAETCMGDRNYPQIALEAIGRMVDETGFLRPWDETGGILATHGTLVRHLVLPDQLENSIRALDMLYEHFGPALPISVMSQFQPMPECERLGLFNTKVEPSIYEKVLEHLDELGFYRVFIQPKGGDDSFAPDFTSDKPFGAQNARK